jgi:tRNA/tmRNA/rRNA uracil-C5-methylase (TrmA/RlmC/RlmD family)
VVFVRHALPGERVLARMTEDQGGSFARADAVRILSAAPERVEPPCPYAGPGRCGGCDWQHVDPAAQRTIKAQLVREQLSRIGGFDADEAADLVGTAAEELPGGPLGWRTRIRYAIDAEGRPGFRRHRSHEVVPVTRCPLATAAVDGTGAASKRWPGVTSVRVVGPSGGAPVVLPGAGQDGRGPRVVEVVSGHRYRVRATGFWQVHPAAAERLVEEVLAGLAPTAGDAALDLYSGAGLFGVQLASRVGVAGSVTCVESDGAACADARLVLRGMPWAGVIEDRVDRALRSGAVAVADVVVLDPPRAGAGAAVVQSLAALGPRAVGYVSCDPATLARDLRTFRGLGYRVARLRVLDAFPMTHHVECVAVLRRD